MTASEPRPEIMALIQEAAAVEREACAQLCDEIARRWRGLPAIHGPLQGARVELAEAIAAQIRARGAPMKENGT